MIKLRKNKNKELNLIKKEKKKTSIKKSFTNEYAKPKKTSKKPVMNETNSKKRRFKMKML